MPGRYLLDTNIAIALLKAEPAVSARIQFAEETYLSTIALGELIYGVRKSQRTVQNLARIAAFLAAYQTSLLPCDPETADHYGTFKARLSERGRPIPENDLWIAATAAQHGLILVTRDGHFSEIEGLHLERW